MVKDISDVLNRFDDKYDELSLTVKEYGIRFITADGRLRTMRARKCVNAPTRALRKPLQPRGKQTFHLKRHGTMLVHDLDIDEPRTVKVATIYAFKDFNSTAWYNVRH